jgi:hypothetical protein
MGKDPIQNNALRLWEFLVSAKIILTVSAKSYFHQKKFGNHWF